MWHRTPTHTKSRRTQLSTLKECPCCLKGDPFRVDAVCSSAIFHIEIEQAVRAIVPLVFRVSVDTEVLAHVPTHLHEGVCILAEIHVLHKWLVEQQEQVPVGIIPGIASGSRTIQIERAALGQHP